jgi:hypothetical protein
MQCWNSDFIRKIFVQKQKERSEDRDNLLKLVSRSLYGEAIHYAMELIQNAEDEGSSSIKFIFDKDHLVVINNGRPFDDSDVWGICSVKTGRKKGKIGFFGIGFKAVFNVTKNPQIISHEFNFELNDFIYPSPLTTIPVLAQKDYSPEKGAIFLLPYCPELAPPDTLIENFGLIDEKLLLFLESLQKLVFEDLIHDRRCEIQKEPSDVFTINETKYFTISLVNTHTGTTKWKVFHRDLPVKDQGIVPEGKQGIEKTRITLAFPLENELREKIRKNGVFYCYLPTKKRTDLPFLIQADFLPTIGRENIADHHWNTWLMQELGVLAGEAINEIKKDQALAKTVYDFIPLTGEVQDELVKQLYESLFKALKKSEIAKSAETWCKPKDCLIPNDDDLRVILSESDLRLFFNERVSYIDPALSEKDGYARPENVLFELGARKIRAEEVIDFLQKEELVVRKSQTWFLDLYDYLSGVFDTSKKIWGKDLPWDWDENIKNLFKRLQITKFILNDEGDVVSLKNPDMQDRLICYPQSIDLTEIHKLFTEGEIIFLNRYFQESSITHRKEDSPQTEEKRKNVKEWFDSIGVQKYFKQAHIIRKVILPKFTTGKYKKYGDLEIFNFLNYIRTYWSSIESEIQNKKISPDILDEIKSSVLVKVQDDYKRPDEIYFSRGYGKNEAMEDLFMGIDGIHFLSTYYLNREGRETRKKKRGRQKVEYSWKDFFKILGVWSSPRVVKDSEPLSIRGNNDYKWINKEYSPSGVHLLVGNSRSHNIERLIGYCSENLSFDDSRARMILLWESLEKNWKFYKDNKYFETRYKWVYYSDQWRTYQTSSFLEFLRESQWVPSTRGNFCKPDKIFTHTANNFSLLGDGVEYTDLKGNDSFLKDLGIRIEPEIDEVLTHLKSFKENNPMPASNEIKKMGAIYSFLHEKLNTKGLDEKEKLAKIEMVRKDFGKYELFYLPREDRSWWKPEEVFWNDMSEVFDTLRGYVQHLGRPIYDEFLRPFFIAMGVIEKPSVRDCLGVLDFLKSRGDLEYCRRSLNKIYSLMDGLIKQEGKDGTDWGKPVFLSEKEHFLPPSVLYYCDVEEYKRLFGDAVEIIWLPFHWDNVKNMLDGGGFHRLGENVYISKRFDTLSEIEGDLSYQFIRRLLFAKSYLNRKNFDLFNNLQKVGVFKRIKGLLLYETPKMLLDYVLTIDGEETLAVRDLEKDSYFSLDENRLYKSSQVPLFSTPVASEIAKLFGPGEDEVFSVLDSLFSAADDEQLYNKLRHFGIQETIEREEESSGGVKIISGTVEEEPEQEEKKKGQERAEEEKPKLPKKDKPEPGKSDLIDPDEFLFYAGEEHTPYVKAEGSKNNPPRVIKLRPGHTGENRDERQKGPRERANRMDAESIALEFSMRYEEDIEFRQVEDRHKQAGIGYDIYSLGTDNDERFIEVKHFRGEAAAWELKPHQWKKAELEQKRYYVFVVSRLKEGSTPKIEIIQNPVKYLNPDPPADKKFSDWKNGVIKTITSQRV